MPAKGFLILESLRHNPPPHPNPSLTDFCSELPLTSISQLNAQLFFRLFLLPIWALSWSLGSWLILIPPYRLFFSQFFGFWLWTSIWFSCSPTCLSFPAQWVCGGGFLSVLTLKGLVPSHVSKWEDSTLGRFCGF